MKKQFRLSGLVVAAAAGLMAQQAVAQSIYLTPDPYKVQPIFTGSEDFTLFMDFSASDPTIGGGIDFALSRAVDSISFVPSNYFTTAGDPAFSGHGTLHADGAYEVHIGNFSGLSGVHELGTVRINVVGLHAGESEVVTLSTNSYYGGFYQANLPNGPMTVDFVGATGTVVAVPEPQAYALMLLGLGVIGIPAAIRRRSIAA